MLPRKRQRVAEIGRVRVTAPIAAAAAAPAAAPGAVAGMESEPLSDADLRLSGASFWLDGCRETV